MIFFRKFLFLSLLLCLLASCGGGSTSSPSSQPKLTVAAEMLWDKDGVPHIFAEDGVSVGYAFGRAQMQMHAELLIRLYAQARGKGAEHYGAVFEAGEPFGSDMLEVDKLVRTMDFPNRAEEWSRAQSPRMKAYLEAFVAGLNEQASLQPLSVEAKSVLPLKVADVHAHTLRTLFTYLTAPTSTGAANCSLIYPSELTGINLIGGSNGWALGPTKTANGKAMLLANPHLLWGGSHTWFEAHFKSPQYDIYGATLVGLPVMRIGFNDRLGWVHTVNSQDGCDLYELKVEGDNYRFANELRPFEKSLQEVKIKKQDGTYERDYVLQRRTVHGTVFVKNGKTYSLRVVGVAELQTPGILEQWWDMAQAADFDAFKKVIARLQNPFHNIIYADSVGNTWSVFGGLTPIRSEGDSAFWAEPVDGNRSELLWTAAHSLDQLPQVENPSSGWVQNSNSVPWFMSKSILDPSKYPTYLSPKIAPSLREQRGIELINSIPKFTLNDLLVAKYDTKSLLAERVLPDLIAFANASLDPQAIRAAAVLSGWDKKMDSRSRGAFLFSNWVDVVGGATTLSFALPSSFSNPFTAPSGLANSTNSVGALIALTADLDANGIPLDVSFGDAYRFRRGKVDFPANGGGDGLGVFRTIEYFPDTDGLFKAISGDSFVALVEFGSAVKAKVINTYGNTSDATSTFFGDQLGLSSRKEMRDALLTRKAIESALSRKENFIK